MMMKFQEFYSKILLFGEYSVICNSMGLTIPFKRFSGRLGFAEELNGEFDESSKNLKGFYNYLKKLSDQKELMPKIDLTSFRNDLDKHLYFNSNIPQGYGAGSSGAICAAIYDAYAIEKDTEPDKLCLPELKQHFAQMESYFHGVSSGLDPLNSYIKKALLIQNKEQLEIVDRVSGFDQNELTVFLIDTNTSGETEHLVQIFFDKCRKYEFYKELRNTLIPLNNASVEQFMRGDLKAFLETVGKLSLFFFEHFKPMIPSGFTERWEKGLEDKLYTLKLCGSGGGGLLLGFTTDYEATIEEFREYKLLKLEV